MSIEFHIHSSDGDLDAEISVGSRVRGRMLALKTAYVMSGIVAATMAAASTWGLLRDNVYHEIPWAEGALRGGDFATLVLATPLLIGSMAMSLRGSIRAQLVWAAMLGYNVYNYAYFSFGTDFNDLFLAHIALLAMSAWALIFLLASLDIAEIRARFTRRTPARSVAGLLIGTGTVLTLLWTSMIIRQMASGELPDGPAPREALHMVYATDLAIFVAALFVSGVLLWLRTGWGFVAGAVMSLMGATYLVNLMCAQAFQAHADVEGISAFSPGPAALTTIFWIAAIAMLLSVRSDEVG